jgi:hypothetical protein
MSKNLSDKELFYILLLMIISGFCLNICFYMYTYPININEINKARNDYYSYSMKQIFNKHRFDYWYGFHMFFGIMFFVMFWFLMKLPNINIIKKEFMKCFRKRKKVFVNDWKKVFLNIKNKKIKKILKNV